MLVRGGAHRMHRSFEPSAGVSAPSEGRPERFPVAGDRLVQGSGNESVYVQAAPVEGGPRDPRRLGEAVDRHAVEAVFGDHLLGRVDQRPVARSHV